MREIRVMDTARETATSRACRVYAIDVRTSFHVATVCIVAQLMVHCTRQAAAGD